MGLLGGLFSGGSKVEVALDVPEVPVGGQLSGKVTVHGGKKPLRLNSLNVRLAYVEVKTKEGSAMPELDLRVLVDSAVAANQDLTPGQAKTYAFRFPLPSGLEPTGIGVSYIVQAHADIPGVLDPKADTKLKVVEGRGDAMLSANDVIDRFPDLQASDSDDLLEAMRQLYLACYSERENLIAIEPLLVELLGTHRNTEVRTKAFSTWAQLVDNQVRPDHIQRLKQIAASDLTPAMMDEVVCAAAKFAEEGALPLVQELAKSSVAHVRQRVARELRSNSADHFAGRRELFDQLAQDPDGGVRAAAVGGLSHYYQDTALVHWFAQVAASDPNADVQAECIGALSLACHAGFGDLALATYEQHLQNPNTAVRRRIADVVGRAPQSYAPRIGAIIQRLFSDRDEEVRQTAAWQFINMDEFPELAPLVQHVAENDPSEDVRADAIYGMSAVTPPDELVARYRAILARGHSDRLQYAVVRGLSDHKAQPPARALLQEIAASTTDAGERAREVLSEE